MVNLLIPLCIMLAPYAILKQYYSVGLFLVLAYSIFSISFLKNDIQIPKNLLYFLIAFVGIYIINVFRTGKSLSMLNFMVGSVLTIFYVSSLVKYFEFNRFYKNYKFLALASSCLVIFQALRLFIFHIPAVPINLLPVAEADYSYWDFFKGKRASGFFSEPQAFCSFVIPFFIFSLYRSEFLFSTITFVAILMSSSTLGLAISVMVMGYYLLFENKFGTSKVFIIGGVALVFIVFASFGLLEYTINKIQKTPLENNIRLVRGFYIYSKFISVDLLFGVSQDLQQYVISNIKEPWVALYTSAGNQRLLGYTTSFSGLLIQFGLPSFIAYLLFLRKCFVNSSRDSKVLILVTFVLCFVQTIIFNAWFVFYISMVLGILKEKNKIKFLTIRL
jgi:hypothetical protein